VREVITSPDEEILEDHDIIESQEPPQMTIFHKRNPAWALMCDLLEKEPTCFE
jgi:hypothetical protein